MEDIKKKLLIKKGKKHLVLNAPGNYNVQINNLFDDFEFTADDGLDWVLLFVRNLAELQKNIASVLALIDSETIFWIAYPKASGKVKTDLSRDAGWDDIFQKGYRTVSLISLDDDYSVMRFREGAMPELTNKKPEKLVLPEELAAAFEQDNQLAIFFNSFAYTHRKEYINWINEAKKEETRAARVSKALQMIANKQKLQ